MRFFGSAIWWMTTVLGGLSCSGGDGTAGPLPQPHMSKSSGDGQTDTARAALPTRYSVTILDANNAPVAGRTVTWSMPTGQGSVSDATTITNASGVASVTRSLGPAAGTQTAQAAAADVTGSPQTFSATVTPGSAKTLEQTGGADFGLVNSSVTYTVAVKDQNGNVKPGVTIDWVAGTGGGSIAPAQNQTGTDGRAGATHTLSGATGSHTATATASVIPQTVTLATEAVASLASVDVNDNFFSPGGATIDAGGAATWSWKGGAGHNVTFEDNLGNSATQTSGMHSRKFTATGTRRYRCTLHSPDFDSGMIGSVTVR